MSIAVSDKVEIRTPKAIDELRDPLRARPGPDAAASTVRGPHLDPPAQPGPVAQPQPDDRDHRRAARAAADGGPRPRGPQLHRLADRVRSGAGQRPAQAVPLRRLGAGQPARVPRGHPGPVGRGPDHQRADARGLLRPRGQRPAARRAGPGAHRRGRHVPLRAARHRQDLHRRAAHPHPRGRRAGAPGRRGRQPGHRRLRPDHPRADRAAAAGHRPPVGAVPAPGHRGRWRADHQRAGPHLRAGQRHLPGPRCRCRPTTGSSSSTTSAARP